jgi:hypothetical protein
MDSGRSITVYGAYGHTGQFVVAELLRRGWAPVLAGRDAGRLAAVAASHGGLPVRPASIDDPAALDRALAGSAAVINCAGPFAATVGPVIEAALRVGIPYLDVAAEIEANLDTFANYADKAVEAGITVLPAMAFFGGLGDLLVTAAMGDWETADEIAIAYGLSGWVPTSGTREAGSVSRQRRGGRRIVYSAGELRLTDGAAPTGIWEFPQPLGKQDVVEQFTMADSVTIPRHFKVPEIRSCMTRAAVSELVGSNSNAAAATGRPAETFIVDVVVQNDGVERRISATGRDIYASSAPLVVEAAARLLDAEAPEPGVFSAGEVFDAPDFLAALSPTILLSARIEKHAHAGSANQRGEEMV